MGIVIFLLSMCIVSGIIVVIDIARARHRQRCQQLKDYIKFLESASILEDANEGAQWLNERAERRAECDIQDINK